MDVQSNNDQEMDADFDDIMDSWPANDDLTRVIKSHNCQLSLR